MYRVTVALLLAIALMLASCTFGGQGSEGDEMGSLLFGIKSEHDIAAGRFKAMLAAIEGKDADALKSEFSKKALSEAEDIDGSIDYLFGLVKGDVVFWEEEAIISGDTINYGKVRKHIMSWYVLTTADDVYNVFMFDYYKDTIDPDNQGLYALRVYRKADVATQGGDSVSMKIPGVYRPE